MTSLHELHHVPLHVAAALAYRELIGDGSDGSSPDWTDRVANDLARALSGVTSVYAQSDGSSPKAISTSEIRDGTFEQAGSSLRTKNGDLLRGLTVDRRDLWPAIAKIKSARTMLRVVGQRSNA